ncbi:MAG: archaellin/type IV pilin N-terminal domain-containing protein [Candidatus Heimdallarchaeota archaeon]
MRKIINLFKMFQKRKRAVSPVIAAILLIGLTVAAGAIVFFIVLPMFESEPEFEVVESQSRLIYSQSETEIQQEGWGQAELMILNSGNAEGEVSSVEVEFFNTSASVNDYEKLPPGDVSALDLPLEVGAADEQQLDVLFKLPAHNILNTTKYRFTLTYEGGKVSVREGAAGDLELSPDMPTLTDFGAWTNYSIFRKEQTIAPTIDENSKLKKIEYFVNGTLNETIDEPASEVWDWNWNTREETAAHVPIASGLPNGTYEITATVTDYAGLSSTSAPLYVQLDNDYTPPVIGTPLIVAPRFNGTGEAGATLTVSVNITDNLQMPASGGVGLYYRTNGTTNNYAYAAMTKDGDTYTGIMDSSKVEMPAMEYHILAEDDVGYETIEYINASSSKNYTVTVVDQTSPNINHTAVQQVNFIGFIQVNAEITDYGTVDATLYYQRGNDTVYTSNYGPWLSMSMINSSGVFSATIDILSTLDGIRYFFNASDTTGNPANNATDGDQANPHHVLVVDNTGPWIEHSNKSSGTAGFDLEIRADSFDNDESYADNVTAGFSTGLLELYYRPGTSGAFSKVDMTTDFALVKTSPEGYKVTSWIGYIPSSVMLTGTTVQYYIKGLDQGFNQGFNNTMFYGTDQDPISLTVITQTFPVIERTGSVSLGTYTTSSDTVSFTIINSGGASGTITHVNVSWSTLAAEILEVSIPDTIPVWNGNGANSSSLDINDKTIAATATQTVDLIFNTSMTSAQITVNFTVTYLPSNTKYDTISFTTPAAPSYDVSYVAGTGDYYRTGGFWNRRYWLDFDVLNNADPVQITQIKLEYSSGETIEQVQWYKGTTQWTGTATSGTIITLASPPTFATGNTQTFTVEFDSSVQDSWFTVTLYYDDGSSQILTQFQAL